MKETLDWLLHIAIALAVGILIVTFVGQRTIVHDISMQPTLVEGDNLLVEKLSTKLGGLHRGDIIVFDDPLEPKQLIKRLIALEGEKVEIREDGKVYINGTLLEEKYLGQEIRSNTLGDSQYMNMVVPKGHVFAMGDNREHSQDSRIFGPVEIRHISGKAIFRFFPFGKFGKLY